MSLMSGSRIGPFEVLEPLGRGGMGEVYRARDPRLDRSVAVKALPRELAADPGRLARFEREAKLLASLSHGNIATLYGLEEADGATYLVLEYVEGESLAQRLTRGSLPVRETLEVGAQIAAAIEAAHERGIVHRDLKPANVMLTPAGNVKVLDFGLAKGGEESERSASRPDLPTMTMPPTAAGVVLGTAPYMSPEQARGAAVDRRTDVWAFGCVLYECLTGRPAFEGETMSDLVARILEREPEWDLLPGSIPAGLRDLVRRCLTKGQSDRPRDIGDLARELRAIAQDVSAHGRAAPARERPSLAVLYFENLSSDPESEYFCAGITEDILTDLSKIQALRVASRNAVAPYRGKPVDLAQVGRELGVGAVLEGSVRKSGNRVRITAQLIHAADGFHLWADRYDRTLEDVFAVQEEIASSIATALRVALTPAESEQIGRDRPADVRAYDLYLKGRAIYYRYDAESLREALGLFRQAIAIDERYALAWAGVADCLAQQIAYGATENVSETARLGLEAARRAIEIDPRLPEGHKAESLVLLQMGDVVGSRAALVRALQADPNFTPALLNLGVLRFVSGDIAGAERMMRRTLDADAHQVFGRVWLASILNMTQRPDEGLSVARAVLGYSDEAFYRTASYSIQTMAHLISGRLVEAEQVVNEAVASGADPKNVRLLQAHVLARMGRAEPAARLLREVESVAGMMTGSLVHGAAAAVCVGDLDRARFLLSPVIVADMAPMIVRLNSELHPMLNDPPFAPRRLDAVLVWPLEAPMIDPARYALFREVHVVTGRPQASEIFHA